MPDILAIVSKAIFERDARVDGMIVAPGEVWDVDRYNSTHKTFQALEDGGRIFLVTVRPPNEQLWFVGLVDSPTFDGSAWIANEPNALPVTDISSLRKSIQFESGKGMSQDRGTLGPVEIGVSVGDLHHHVHVARARDREHSGAVRDDP